MDTRNRSQNHKCRTSIGSCCLINQTADRLRFACGRSLIVAQQASPNCSVWAERTRSIRLVVAVSSPVLSVDDETKWNAEKHERSLLKAVSDAGSTPAASTISSSKIIQQHPKASTLAGFFIGLLSIDGQPRRLTSGATGGNWEQVMGNWIPMKRSCPFMPLTNAAIRNVKHGNKPASLYSCPAFSN